jgi:hypothetical protein
MSTQAAFSRQAQTQTVDGTIDGLAPLKKIAMIGALRPCEYGAGDHDSADLTAVVDCLMANGLINRRPDGAPDIEVDVINLAYGQDFLVEQPECDVAVIAYLPKPGIKRVHVLSDIYRDAVSEDADLTPELKDSFFRCVSRYHTTVQWNDALEASAARMVVTVGGLGELTADDLSSVSSFNTYVSPSAQEYTRKLPKPSPLGLPSQFFGVMLREDYVSEILKHSTSDAPLIRKIRRDEDCRAKMNSSNPFKIVQGWFNSVCSSL